MTLLIFDRWYMILKNFDVVQSSAAVLITGTNYIYICNVLNRNGFFFIDKVLMANVMDCCLKARSSL